MAGGYENVPTRDIHMNQVGFDQSWMEFLRLFVKPLQELVFTGYYHDVLFYYLRMTNHNVFCLFFFNLLNPSQFALSSFTLYVLFHHLSHIPLFRTYPLTPGS